MIHEEHEKTFGPASISLGELEDWLNQNLDLPSSDDEPFIVDHKILYFDDLDSDEQEKYEDDFDENTFRFFVSTKRLLNLALKRHHMNADATYKLNWQGFPILLCGTTDSDKKFHGFGLAVSTNEKKDDFKFIIKNDNLINNKQ